MASAFDVDRKKLGLLGSSPKSSSKSAFDADRVKLGLIQAPEEDKKSLPTALVLEDTLKSVMKPTTKTVDFKAEQAKNKEAAKPAASSIRITPQEPQETVQSKLPAGQLLQTNEGIQQTLQGKLPAASLVQQTGRGPENASQIPGISQYEITKKEIEEDNAPGIVKAYANAMNYITQGNPVGQAVSRSFAGNSGATRRDSTGNKTVDKITDVINNVVTPFITPTGAPLGQGIIGSTYGATEKALSGKAGQAILKGAGKVIPGSDNVVKSAATEAIAGGMQGVGFGLQNGRDQNNQIISDALFGTVAGGILGGAGAKLGEVIGRFRAAGIPDDEIADIAPELLALPEAQPRTMRKQLAGEIKTTPSGDTIATPYTPQLNAATPETQAAASARQAARAYDPVELNTKYAQEVIDEYKMLKNTTIKKVSNKNLYEQARQNVDARRPTDAQLTTQKLKDTRVNGESYYTGEPVIRNPQTPSREQEIYNKANRGEALTQDEIEFAMSPQFNKDALFPDEWTTPKESTYVKPRTIKTEVAKVEPKVEVKAAQQASKVKSEIPKKTLKEAATIVKKEQTPGIRANYKTISESGNVSSPLKAGIKRVNQKYDIAHNVDTVAKANENVKNLDAAYDAYHGAQKSSAEHIATGYRLMQEFDKLGYHEKALNVVERLAKDLTEAGQTVQAASLIRRLSPEGQLLHLVRTAEKAGKTVTVADKAKFSELAVKVQENSAAPKAENAINDILDRLEKGEKVTPEDIRTLGDYLKNAESKVKTRVVKDKMPKELNDVRKRDKVVNFLEEAEAAAKKRIEKRRGRLNSLPVAEWTDYSIIIASKVAKGIIKAETHIEDIVKLFGEDIRPIATKVFEKAQEIVSGVTKGTLEGDLTKANQAFKRITGQEKDNLQERIVEKYLKENPKVDVSDVAKLRKLAKGITELSGDNKIKADMEMQKILNSYEKSSPMDKVNALRYIGMLLNTATQAINAGSGPIMATTGRVADIFGVMIDTAISPILKQPRSTTLYGSNPVRFMADYFKGLKIGAKAGWDGVNPSGIQGANEIRGLTYKGKYNPLSYVERTLGAVAKGPDYATYSAVYKGEIQKQGFLEATRSGIKRSDKEAIKNYIRKFVNDPPEAAIEQADRIAKNTTFQRDDTLGGQAANFLNSGQGKVKTIVNPVIRTVFPFVRTPINIASTAFTMSPGGIIKGLIQLSSLSNASQREAIRTLSLGITGTGGLSVLGYYLNQVGIITGANDSGDKNVDNIREQAGKGKYRFNTSAMGRYVSAMLNGEGFEAAEKAAKYQKGDKAFDYNKLQPVAFPLALGAEFSNQKDKTIGARLSNTAVGAAGSLFGMSTLKGVQDVFQPQYGGTQGEKAAGVGTRLAESFFKSFSPSALAQEARRQDPIVRKTPYNDGLIADVGGYFKSRTPGLSKSLPANKDTLGQSKMNAPGFTGQYLNPYKSEVANYTTAAAFIVDLMDRTGDTSLAPKPPEKKVRGKNEDGETVSIAIPMKRYEKLQEDIGNGIKDRVMMIEPGTDEEQAEELRTIYEEVRAEYMDEVKEELGIE